MAVFIRLIVILLLGVAAGARDEKTSRECSRKVSIRARYRVARWPPGRRVGDRPDDRPVPRAAGDLLP
jgi:hypothetical protein